MPQNLRNYTKEVFVKNAGLTLDNYNFSHNPYVSTTKIMEKFILIKGLLILGQVQRLLRLQTPYLHLWRYGVFVLVGRHLSEEHL